MVASEILGRLGVELEIANNGREAVDMISAAPDRYAAVLMDIQMPEMDGLAATRALREMRPVRNLPIIAMTANAMDSRTGGKLVAHAPCRTRRVICWKRIEQRAQTCAGAMG